MIAKIGHGTHLPGALYYNEAKVDEGNASILLLHKMQETMNNKYTVHQLMRSFEPYLTANKKTEKPALHISLNPDPKDQVSDAMFMQMAQQYMQEMCYGGQPYVVFKHQDIERTHIHIVSTNVDRNGRKISDQYEKKRSMDACRKLEQDFGLHVATIKTKQNNQELFRPVLYRSGNIKSQIAAVVRHLPKYYRFSTFGTYNALLSLFHITAEQVTAEAHGQTRQGLLYFAINEKGEKASPPFKSSLFGKAAGWQALQEHFEVSKAELANSKSKIILKSTVEVALHSSKNQNDFKQQLIVQGINTVVRRNQEGRLYGITFVDHESRTVWNGSQLGKYLSANTFHEYWNNTSLPKSNLHKPLAINRVSSKQSYPSVEIHPLFDFFDIDFSKEESAYTGVSLLADLLDQPQSENSEELGFEWAMKKRKRKHR